MSRSVTLKINPQSQARVENFRQSLFTEAENMLSRYIPDKIMHLDALLKDDALNVKDTSSLKAPLDIPIPDPPSPDDEEMETDKNEDDEKKKKKPPKCGFIKSNEKILLLIERVKPEIVDLRETIINMSAWINFLIPKIEDGNDFGVAIQEKILERIAAVRTKVETYQTNLNKYFTERGDAVAKASKETHVMDYRSLVHDKDEAIYGEIKVIVLEIRSFYIEMYTMVIKNLEKVTNPKGEEKPPMY